MTTLDELAEQARAGNRDALEGLVRGLQGTLHALSLRMLGDPEPARDATQEILILIVTQLGSFRGESAVSTWAYRIALRHLARQRGRTRRFSFESLADDDLGRPSNDVHPDTLARSEERLLAEEVFVGCTQAMLLALDRPARLAFVLGALLDLEASECAAVLGISEVAFRKRLSRARGTLDAFVDKHCGVANPTNACRCAFQVNHNVALGRIDPDRLRYAAARSTPTTLQALGEIRRVRRSLELYRAQNLPVPDFAEKLRELLDSATALA